MPCGRTAESKETETGAVRLQTGLWTSREAGGTEQRERSHPQPPQFPHHGGKGFFLARVSCDRLPSLREKRDVGLGKREGGFRS